MNHEQAFLQAIRETPHDDAPRLIYADWLEEQGGAARAARADFIRIQCRLDGMPEDDPARDRLEDEMADLLAEHEAEWTQPLCGIAEDWRFTRGFIERIRIRGDNLLSHAERLFGFAPLRSLHLLISRNDIPQLTACPQLRWISTLDFSRCQLNDRSMQQLLTSPHIDRLNALNLDGNDINTPGIRALIRSPLFHRLSCLDLSRNRALGDTAARLLAHAVPTNNLEVLSLANTNLTSEGALELLNSTSLPRLMELDISGARELRSYFGRDNPPGSSLLIRLRCLNLNEFAGPTAILNVLPLLPSVNLQSLSLRNTAAETRDTKLLGRSACLANLTSLDLRYNRLGAEGLQSLVDSPHLGSLTRLDVGFNNIRDIGARSIAESPHLKRLRVLELAGNSVGGPGLKAVVESSNLELLRTLNLAGNFIGVDSVRALAGSTPLQKLTFLDLSDASLEEDSARILASSANLTRLTTLLLQKNRLGDGGAKELAHSPHLTRLATLDLSANRIGKAGAEALATASWRRMRNLDLRGNVFTDTEEALLRNRFGNAVQL